MEKSKAEKLLGMGLVAPRHQKFVREEGVAREGPEMPDFPKKIHVEAEAPTYSLFGGGLRRGDLGTDRESRLQSPA